MDICDVKFLHIGFNFPCFDESHVNITKTSQVCWKNGNTLGHTHYILRLTSPQMCWNHSRQEKKMSFQLFFPLTCQGSRRIFYLIDRISLKNSWNISNKNKKPGLSIYFFIRFYLQQGSETPCRDPSTAEYCECALTPITEWNKLLLVFIKGENMSCTLRTPAHLKSSIC